MWSMNFETTHSGGPRTNANRKPFSRADEPSIHLERGAMQEFKVATIAWDKIRLSLQRHLRCAVQESAMDTVDDDPRDGDYAEEPAHTQRGPKMLRITSQAMSAAVSFWHNLSSGLRSSSAMVMCNASPYPSVAVAFAARSARGRRSMRRTALVFHDASPTPCSPPNGLQAISPARYVSRDRFASSFGARIRFASRIQGTP